MKRILLLLCAGLLTLSMTVPALALEKVYGAHMPYLGATQDLTLGSYSISGTNGTFTGDVSGVNGSFTGTVQAPWVNASTGMVSDGDMTAYGFTFNGDTDTGLFNTSANTAVFNAGGVRMYSIINTSAAVNSGRMLFNGAAYHLNPISADMYYHAHATSLDIAGVNWTYQVINGLTIGEMLGGMANVIGSAITVPVSAYYDMCSPISYTADAGLNSDAISIHFADDGSRILKCGTVTSRSAGAAILDSTTVQCSNVWLDAGSIVTMIINASDNGGNEVQIYNQTMNVTAK
jgi:hypothetical protein